MTPLLKLQKKKSRWKNLSGETQTEETNSSRRGCRINSPHRLQPRSQQTPPPSCHTVKYRGGEWKPRLWGRLWFCGFRKSHLSAWSTSDSHGRLYLHVWFLGTLHVISFTADVKQQRGVSYCREEFLKCSTALTLLFILTCRYENISITFHLRLR